MEKIKRAIFSGSFDPVTEGHADVIRRASELFDELYVCILENAEKTGMFTAEERLTYLRTVTDEISSETGNVIYADTFSGLTSDYMNEKGITYIVKGIRNSTDFDYEYGISLIMDKFLPGCETVLFPAAPSLMHVSSTYVRELVRHGCPLTGAVPECAAKLIESRENK